MLGTLFAIHHWFSRKSRVACFFTGAAATPLLQYLWMLFIAVVWPNAPRFIWIGILPLLSGLYGLLLIIRYARRIPVFIKKGTIFFLQLCKFDKLTLIPLCFVLALTLLLLPVGVRLCISMNAANSADSGEYMGLALRFCEDRDLGKLLEKDENEGRYRGHSHFPSLEIYMAYGLMLTNGEDYGYPADKPMLTAVGLLNMYMVAAYIALVIVLTRERKRWLLLGILLLNLVPNLFFSANGAPRDIWRIIAVFIAALFLLSYARCLMRKVNGVWGFTLLNSSRH